MATESTHNGDAPQTTATSRLSTWRSVLDLTATVLVSVAAVAVLWTAVRGATGGRAAVPAPREVAVPSEPQSLDGAPILGDPAAKVVIIEYSDFQCPFCGKFARETLPGFEKKYVSTGKAKIVFRHVPLEQAHPFALGAAVAAECAEQQGRFW
ncbi:MAG: DsbA family protein, partial [Gemmatimonadaceae bacterium]